MQSLILTEDRFKSLLSSPSSLLQLNSILEASLKQDNLFLLKTFLLYFSDRLDPKFQNYLGSTLKYLMKMAWPSLCVFQKKFIANFTLLVLKIDRLVEFEVIVSIFEDLSSNLKKYSNSENPKKQTFLLFSPQMVLMQKLSEILVSRSNQQSLLANPNTINDIALMIRTILDLQKENESLQILQSIFSNFETRPSSEWGGLLQILLILFEKGDDRMHVTFHLSFSQLLLIHNKNDVSDAIRLKCLQLVYLVIKTINWTDSVFTPSSKAQEKQMGKLLGNWVEVLCFHLDHSSQSHVLFVFKIMDEIFKDQKEMTKKMAPHLLPGLTLNFARNLKKYLNLEVFPSSDNEGDFVMDMENCFEYTLDEDQHYSNITQSILIKFLDILQSITFSQDEILRKFLTSGCCFLVQSFFLLSLMSQEDLFLWKEEPNQYIQDEDDETNLYAIKPSVVSVLYSLIEEFPELFTEAIVVLGEIYIQNFIGLVRLAGMENFKFLFEQNSEIYRSSQNSEFFMKLKLASQLENHVIFKKISNFISSICPEKKTEFIFILHPEDLFSSLSLPQKTFNLFVDHWKKIDATLMLVVDFVKDIMSLSPQNESKLNQYGQICLELLTFPLSDVLTGRSIWAISTLKHFSSSDSEFLEIYSLVCQFLSPKTALSVRLCSSRTITKMSFKIASEKKQTLVASKIGEKMRDLHLWVVDLMAVADEKTFHLVIDNLISFYDICPELLTQELSVEHCRLFLNIFQTQTQNGILVSCFMELFKKIGENQTALLKFWPQLVEGFSFFVKDALLSKQRQEIEFERKMETLGLIIGLLSLCSKISIHFEKSIII